MSGEVKGHTETLNPGLDVCLVECVTFLHSTETCVLKRRMITNKEKHRYILIQLDTQNFNFKLYIHLSYHLHCSIQTFFYKNPKIQIFRLNFVWKFSLVIRLRVTIGNVSTRVPIGNISYLHQQQNTRKVCSAMQLELSQRCSFRQNYQQHNVAN